MGYRRLSDEICSENLDAAENEKGEYELPELDVAGIVEREHGLPRWQMLS